MSVVAASRGSSSSWAVLCEIVFCWFAVSRSLTSILFWCGSVVAGSVGPVCSRGLFQKSNQLCWLVNSLIEYVIHLHGCWSVVGLRGAISSEYEPFFFAAMVCDSVLDLLLRRQTLNVVSNMALILVPPLKNTSFETAESFSTLDVLDYCQRYPQAICISRVTDLAGSSSSDSRRWIITSRSLVVGSTCNECVNISSRLLTSFWWHVWS